MNGVLAGRRAAFRADRLIAVGTAIGAIGQLGTAPWTFAGEIKPAVRTYVSIGIDFGAAFGAGKDHDRQCRATVNADVFVFQREPMALGAHERIAVGARAGGRVEARFAAGALNQLRHDNGRPHFAERRAGERGFLGGQGVVTGGAFDWGGVDRVLAVRARSGKQPVARGTDRRGGQQLESALGTIEEEIQITPGTHAIVLLRLHEAARAERGTAGTAYAILGEDQCAAGGTAITLAGRRVAEDGAAIGTLRRPVRDFVLAFWTVQDKRRAALRADERIGLQSRAAGRTALAFAVRANVRGVGHGLAAMRARLKFFFKRQAAVRAFHIDRADVMSTFRTGQRPRLAAVEAGRGAGGHRLMALRTKFLAAVIAHIGVTRQFGKAVGALHG